MNLEESMRLSTAQVKYNCEPIISHTALGMIHEEAVLRLLNDLDNEIADCRKEAAKLSSKSDILAAWKLKIEKDLLNQTYE